MAENASTFIETVRNVIVTYKGTLGEPVSLSDVGKIARIEPITLLSSSLTGIKELNSILHGVLNIYSAYYLQAVNILAAQLSDVRILKILDKTNPDRDIKTLLTSGYTAYENYKTLSLENTKYKLPMLNKSKIALESIFDYDFEDKNSLSTSVKKLETFENLGYAIGKILDIKFKVPGEKKEFTEISIPVVVKLDTMIVPAEVVQSIIGNNKQDITFGSRLKDALTGRIRFIKDFILCSDLIKAQKKSMIKDPTGFYNQLIRRMNNSRVFSALSGNISLAGISSIYVISEEDEQFIQKQIGGKLTNESTRNIVFDNINAMMIVVVDREWNRVSIYIRDTDSFTQSDFDSFKSMTNKDNNNIMDILKVLQLGSAPAF